MSPTMRAGVKFGGFALVTLLATALLAATISNYSGRATRTLHAVFTDAVNLTPGDDVRLAGVRVGTVGEVALYHGTQALVTFDVDRSIPVTSTTEAVIRYRNLIGQRYLALVPQAGGRALPPGSVIPVSRTRPALNLTALFNGFRPLLVGLSPADVNRLSTELVQVLQGEGGTVDALFGQLGTLTSTIANRDALVGSVITNLNGVLGPVARHDAELSALLVNLRAFLGGLGQDSAAIGSSLASLNTLTGTTASLLTQARAPLKVDLAQLGSLAEQLDEPASYALLKHFLTYTPFKLQVSTPETSYGAFLNFYVCAVNFILPNGTETPFSVNNARRCHVNPTIPPGA